MTVHMQVPSATAQTAEWLVGWSRGRGCSELAAALGHPRAVRDDWHKTCVNHKLDLLVTRRMPGFDLVPIAVPSDVDLAEVGRVIAAIGDGPHSRLASEVAARLSRVLEVPGELATVARPGTPADETPRRLAGIAAAFPDLDLRVIEASAATALVRSLNRNDLLVLGAPGGSWLQRQLLGPGHRMRVTAPGGAVVVRHAPIRCFHAATPAAGQVAGPHLGVGEALRLFTMNVIPVAEAGKLVGIVRRSALVGVPQQTEIGELMEPPVAVGAAEPATAAIEVWSFLDGGPVPVVDGSGHLVGAIRNLDLVEGSQPS